jgi:tetratricopeptide (TPR) repeat protein
VAAWQDWLGRLHVRSDAWASARAARLEVLAIRTKLYGEHDWRVTDARLALLDVDIRSRLSRDQRRELEDADRSSSNANRSYRDGDTPRAIAFAQRALEARRRLLGGEHPQTTVGTNDLATFYRIARDFKKAEPLFREALEVRSKVLGELHPDTAQSFSELGLVYEQMNASAKAEPLYRKALEIRSRIFGEWNLQTSNSLVQLGRGVDGDFDAPLL